MFGTPSNCHRACMAASAELEAWAMKCLMEEPWMSEMVWRVIANKWRNTGTLDTLTEAENEVKLVLWE